MKRALRISLKRTSDKALKRTLYYIELLSKPGRATLSAPYVVIPLSSKTQAKALAEIYRNLNDDKTVHA